VRNVRNEGCQQGFPVKGVPDPSTGALYILSCSLPSTPLPGSGLQGPVVNMPDGGAYRTHTRLPFPAFFALFLIAAYAPEAGSKKYSPGVACVFACPFCFFAEATRPVMTTTRLFRHRCARVYRTLLNGASSSDLSVRKYYQDMSNNRMTFSFRFFGPCHGTVRMVVLRRKTTRTRRRARGPARVRSAQQGDPSYGETDFSRYDNTVTGASTRHRGTQGRGEESGPIPRQSGRASGTVQALRITATAGGPVSTGEVCTSTPSPYSPEYFYAPGDTTIGGILP
jgi:hypothetical protein